MIEVRPARVADAPAIAAVHVAAWRSAYAGVLPELFLAKLSAPRQAAHYRSEMMHGHAGIVAVAGGHVVGFVTMGPSRSSLAEGEIETLYVLDDWRERGLGRRLMHAAAQHLAASGCSSAFLWVLRDNPSRWFYERLRGHQVASGKTLVAGVWVAKDAYVWHPIDFLLQMPAAPPESPEVPD